MSVVTMSKDFNLKCIAILLALIQPIIILIFFGGEIISISSTWGGDLQPLFICTNAMISYFLFQTKEWVIPSMFLLLLTAFSVNLFPTLHNLLAVCFFVSNLYPLMKTKTFKTFGLVYILAIPICWFSFFWMEVWAIYVLSAYHIKTMYIIWKYEHR